MAKYRKSKTSYHYARQNKGSFAWVWLLTGMVLGILGVIYTYPLFENGFSVESIKRFASNKLFKQTKHSEATNNYSEKVIEQKVIIKKKEPNEHYEFYTMLPDMEVSVPKKSVVQIEKPKEEVPIIISSAHQKLDNHTMALIQKLKEQNEKAGQTVNIARYQTGQNQIVKNQNIKNQYLKNQKPHQKNINPTAHSRLKKLAHKNHKINQAQQNHKHNKTLKLCKENKKEIHKGNRVTNPSKDKTQAKIPIIIDKRKESQYLIQTGLYRSLKEADGLKARLALLGFNTQLQKIAAEDGLWFRVVMGPFVNESLAVAEQKRLQTQKIKGVLVMQRKLK